MYVKSDFEEVFINEIELDNCCIFEFLELVGEMDDMFIVEDDSSLLWIVCLLERDDVFVEENGVEFMIEEFVIVVEKYRVVDEDGNVIEESYKIV